MPANFSKQSVIYTVLLTITISNVVSCNSIRHFNPKALAPKKSIEALEQIRFNSSGKLRIVQITDLHYGEGPDTEWGPEADRKSTKVIEDILGWENPDFVVFTGDQISGEVMYANATDYIGILLKPVVEKGYRWASVYGNHDMGANVTRLSILQAEQAADKTKTLCYTKQMIPELPGVTNFFIPVYAPESNGQPDPNEKPIMLWWFLDSQGGQDKNGQQPHYIDQAVVDWYGNESRRMQAEWGVLPALMFFHIPPSEYVGVQESVATNPLCAGLQDEAVTPQDINTGIMKALTDVGGVSSIFVGHDHGNAWCCFYKDIRVCYNRHTGYGGYGQWTRGARVIELDMDRLMNSTNYIRLETGDIVDRFPRE